MKGYIIVSTTYDKTTPGVSLEEKLYSPEFRSRIFATPKEAQDELIGRIQVDAKEYEDRLFPSNHFSKEEKLEKVGGILIGGAIIFRYATKEEACVVKYRIRTLEIEITATPGLRGINEI